MSLRQLPGALILGLLASLTAHAAGFGGSHTEAGAYHELLSILAFAGAGGALVAAVAAAFGSCGNCVQGSVLAARMCTWIPRARAVAFAGGVWFAVIESLEPAHGPASFAIIGLAMLVAALALRGLAVLTARALATCALAVARVATARRALFVVRRYESPAVVTPHVARRIVTRPPPRLDLLPA
ncbi:MAG: hypothetical protein JO322_15185 [Candidatus Eremiobacteraeota bacterium]|nr:hypothetical protein [Candidatus Eremiobacteraeota bacterium]